MSTTWRRAICWRWSKGRIGERYILGGEDVSLRDMLAEIAGLTGRTAADRRACRARRSFRWPIAAEAVARVTGKEPFLTARCAEDGALPHVLLLGQGRARAGLHARGPTREALADALAWFREAGYLT